MLIIFVHNTYLFIHSLICFLRQDFSCSPDCLGTLSVDQVGLELRDSSTSAGIKGVCRHRPLAVSFVHNLNVKAPLTVTSCIVRAVVFHFEHHGGTQVSDFRVFSDLRYLTYTTWQDGNLGGGGHKDSGRQDATCCWLVFKSITLGEWAMSTLGLTGSSLPEEGSMLQLRVVLGKPVYPNRTKTELGGACPKNLELNRESCHQCETRSTPWALSQRRANYLPLHPWGSWLERSRCSLHTAWESPNLGPSVEMWNFPEKLQNHHSEGENI